jgi:UDP-glucuronate 4-epimerase
VSDIVAGVMAAIEYDPGRTKAVPFEVFNLGNSHPVKLNELVDLLERATGKKALRDPKPLQLGDVPLTWAEISKAERLLGYRPATPLAEGLLKFVRWYRAADSVRRA